MPGLVETGVWERLQGAGIPAHEMGALTQAVQDERIRGAAPKNRFSDPEAQRLSNLWFSLRTQSTVEQRNEAGIAYIAFIMGLGEEVARGFAEGEGGACDQVGEVQHRGYYGGYGTALRAFWQRINEIFPGLHTGSDIKLLVEETQVGTRHFINQIDVAYAEYSPVLRRLHISAHANK